MYAFKADKELFLNGNAYMIISKKILSKIVKLL